MVTSNREMFSLSVMALIAVVKASGELILVFLEGGSGIVKCSGCAVSRCHSFQINANATHRTERIINNFGDFERE